MSNRRKTPTERAEKRGVRCQKCGSKELALKKLYGVVCTECGAKQRPRS